MSCCPDPMVQFNFKESPVLDLPPRVERREDAEGELRNVWADVRRRLEAEQKLLMGGVR